MKSLKWITVNIIFLTVLNIYANNADAKITIKVLNENSIPVNNANVGVGFANEQKKKIDNPKGETNSAGLFEAEGETYGESGYSVRKNEYYPTFGDYRWIDRPGKIINGRWEPWNPTVKVVLKKIINPIPMYVKSVYLKLPKEGEPIGFDLEKADWVAPYGKGIISDFIFDITRNIINNKNFTVTLKTEFSNNGDGIKEIRIKPFGSGSELRSPHKAPVHGYDNPYIHFFGQNSKGYFNLKDELTTSYVFRVRSETDKDGNVISAMYGKVYGTIELIGCLVPKMKVRFTYYLNPDGTRNIEFAPNKNLFKDDGNKYNP